MAPSQILYSTGANRDSVSNEVMGIAARRNHRRYILSILFLMILVNVLVRYPLDHVTPMGSDTYFTLDLGRSLTAYGEARWIISPLSYFGLYPLSYPSGTPFAYAEMHILSGLDWNAIPLASSLFFTLLFILGGFLLFRAFRLRDDLSAFLAGLMALSPLFLYFTYEQASGRGFLIPIFMMGLFVVVWPLKRSWSTPILFVMLTFTAFAIHRSSLLIVLFEGMAGLVLALAPIVTRKSSSIRRAAYAGCIAFGLSMVIWPYVPGLNDLLGSVSAISSSFRTAEWEFRTGFFFSGDSLAVLLMNLGTNYVGGIGLILVLLPIGFMAVYPTSRDSREHDIFIIASFLCFAPFVWKAQYIQLIIMPFSYLLAGLAYQRRIRVKEVIRAPSRLLRKRPKPRVVKRERARLRTVAMSLFFVMCFVFSMFMFNHRSNIEEPSTREKNWPNDSEANLGIYIGAFETENRNLISVSGILDRRIGWYSGWDSPITDAATLQASGYLNASTDTFTFKGVNDSYFDYLTTFYNINSMFVINSSAEEMDHYYLSWPDIFGFFRLYYENSSHPWFSPKLSTDEARISILIEITELGDCLSNIYLGQGVLYSRVLDDITSHTYKLYENEIYSSYLVTHMDSGG